MNLRHHMTALALTLSVALGTSAPPLAAAGDSLGLNLSSTGEVLSYVKRHRDDVGLVAFELGPDGQPIPGQLAISHLPDEPMPLGSTFKILVLAAYARGVAAGDLDPGREVALADWERFYLPGTDGGAHPAALAALGIAADDRGFAVDPAATVPLDRLAGVMISASDNAATDYLRELLGPAALESALAAAGLRHREPPRSILGTFLSWENHVDGDLDPQRLETLLAMSPDVYSSEVERLAGLYSADPDWRAGELAWRAAGGPELHPWNERRAAHALFVKGSAGDFARLMAGILSGTLFSASETEILRRHLEWPMATPEIGDYFSALGTKGGSLLGVLTDATYYEPRVGPFAGRRLVCVVFLREMPLLSWLKLSGSGATQLFQLRIAVDPAFAARVARALGD